MVNYPRLLARAYAYVIQNAHHVITLTCEPGCSHIHCILSHQVFFFIDPDFAKDPNMKDITDVTLSYTFWKSSVANDIDEEDGEEIVFRTG